MKIFDGGMGSMLIKYPEYSGKDPALLNLTHPEIISEVHQKYALAGAEYITTNTFDVNPLKYSNYEEIIDAAIKLARKTGCKIVLDIGPIGQLMYPMGLLKPEEAYEMFSKIVRAGNSADLIIIETMIDENELECAIKAAKDSSSLPIFATCAFNQRGRLLTTGARPADVVALAEKYGIDAVGTNCSFGPDKMLPVVEAFASLTSLPIIAQPNAGLPRTEDGQAVYDVDIDGFVLGVKALVSAGASIIGGCCGTTPDYIEALVKEFNCCFSTI
ncbi:MAG: homocysteine methyltransferase [Ruminococcaceae bacterium]|nr:homocysteine methyltransferase [Oscillospiraceae bacterium]